jgi:hypothetical protein
MSDPGRSDSQPADPRRQHVHVSYQGRGDPHTVRGQVVEAALDALVGSHQTVEVPDDIDWQDPQQPAALEASAKPETLMRFTYPVRACTCLRIADGAPHLMGSKCPMPPVLRSEVSGDGGRTWQDTPG